MNQAKPSRAQTFILYNKLKFEHLGLYQAQAKLEHFIFAVESSLNIYNSKKLGLFTALEIRVGVKMREMLFKN